MKGNTKYKDSLFSLLFSNEETLRELYQALTGTILPANIPIVINTLQDVFYMDRVNDISFTVDNRLVVLIEHQSTINPNMALRLLMYVARLYEKILDDKNIYATRPLSIPRPLFYVLYNGTDPYPDKVLLKLSDLFAQVSDSLLVTQNNILLELTVEVFNINEGKNLSIQQHSQTLAGYTVFIERVRINRKQGLNKEEALAEAIKYCKKHDTLKEFLEKHTSEVFNMLMTEWNIDDAQKVWFNEGRVEGKQEGKQEGKLEGIAQSEARIASKLLASGMTATEIALLTDINLDVINSLKK